MRQDKSCELLTDQELENDALKCLQLVSLSLVFLWWLHQHQYWD